MSAHDDNKNGEGLSLHLDEVHDSSVTGLTVFEERQRTPEEKKIERKLLLKIDFIILPLLALVYFLASMDRGDLANAAVAGMSENLHLTGKQLANCVSLFYVGYIVFQLPGDLFLRKVTPPIQLCLAMVSWGLVTTLLSQARNYATLAGLRVVIGAAEAFVQAAPLYVTLWYKRNELASRIGILFSMQALAGSFNGLIAYGIETNLNGALGVAAWQWIFLIEGPITIACGFIILALLPPVPEKVRFGFTEAEKSMAMLRSREAYNTLHAKITPKQLLGLMKDVKIYLYIVLYCCTNVNLASVGGFLPLIIKSLGYKSVHAQLLTIPVFACAVTSILIFGFASDRTRHRGGFLVTAYAITAVGWIILLVAGVEHKKLAFGGTFVIAVGTYPTVILSLGWLNSNIIGFTKRAASLAAINMVGQSFSIAGSMVFDSPPTYRKGKIFALSFALLGMLVAALLMGYLHVQNHKKRQNQHTPDARERRRMDLEEICEDHPDFFYWL
ncbi:hypothetical protein H2204_001803 [Knufia peltigerae]|uniref:Major facilitator superfamily (MFS) profile domain-containing protein n=1 Tax=Knufia peltigerae TaxID=1002370 RepID=A0AA38YBZ2_9EURO|nr:hypothetical protein H2204_001803 [Knufia peltigerae]